MAVELGDEIVGPDHGSWIITDRHVMRLWFARVTAGEPQPLVEHDELTWLDAGSWLDVPWLDADVRIVEELARQVAPRRSDRQPLGASAVARATTAPAAPAVDGHSAAPPAPRHALRARPASCLATVAT